MLNPACKEHLATAASEVLETMFFTVIYGEVHEPGPEAGAEEQSPVLAARLDFLGQPSGEFHVALTEPAALAVAANFIGAEDDSEVTPERVGEVLCELANILCGAVLSRFDSSSNFKLCHPELIAAANLLSLEAATAGATYDLGNGTLSARVRFAEQ